MTPLRPAARIARIVGLGQTRSLHMTGVNTYASKLLASTDGKTSSSSAKQSATSSSYPFNVSRSMKTVKDSSTVDFAFLPDVASIEPSRSQPLRVPRVDFMSGAEAEQSTDQVIPPQIYTAAGDAAHIASHSAMSSVVPANGEVDLEASSTVSVLSKSAQQGHQSNAESSFSFLWSGFLDDLLGPKAKPSSA